MSCRVVAELAETEARIAAGFEYITREMFRIGVASRRYFALVDAVTKTFLTCVPEPPAEATSQAVARPKSSYARLTSWPARAYSRRP